MVSEVVRLKEGEGKIPLTKPILTREMEEMVIKVLRSGQYVLGEENRLFEREFAHMIGKKHAITTNSGTAALYMALKVLNIGRGDEVILPSFTFWASAEVVLILEANPVFCELNPLTFTLDHENVEASLSKKTKAIMPVHLFGHPTDMDPMLKISSERDISIVEDCCQGHGAQYKHRPVGSFGELSCFSFYPSKNITVAGEGGMLVTDNEELAEKARLIRNHGQVGKYLHSDIGFNFRLNEINAAVGRIQLKKLYEWVDDRRNLASAYNDALKNCAQVTVPMESPWAYHSYTNYVLRVQQRDELNQWLQSNGVSSTVHYRVPCHRQLAYMVSGGKKTSLLPKTDDCAEEVLTLPLYPQMTLSDVVYVSELIKKFFQ